MHEFVTPSTANNLNVKNNQVHVLLTTAIAHIKDSKGIY